MPLFRSRPEQIQRINPLRPGQEGLYSQLLASTQGPGAGGSFGESADYYRSLLGGEGFEDFERPLQRQFSEDTLPSIAEQFAGLGAGGLSSGGFAQEAGRASTDLAERIAQLRAGLRQQGAEGLMGLGQRGMQPIDEMVLRPRQPSLFEQFSTGALPGLAQGLGSGLSTQLFGNFLTK